MEADRLTREPVGYLAPKPNRRPAGEDTDFLGRIVATIETMGEASMSDLTEHLAATAPRVRAGLERLQVVGAVTRTGIKSGTRYVLADEDADPVPAHVRELETYETMVRDAAVALGTFTFAEIVAEMPGASEPTIRRWLGVLEKRGVLTSEKIGVAKLYDYVEPEPKTTNRTRRPAPEHEAVATVERQRPKEVTSGRHARTGSTLVNGLIREVRQHGVTIKRTAHKVVFMRDGVEIAHASSTPGASSLKETRANLRKAGVPV